MEQQQHTQHSYPKLVKTGKYPIPDWFLKLLLAAALTILIHFIFLFVIYGEVSGLSPGDGFEIFFTFLYFISLFWIYPKISRFINSERFSRLPRLTVKFIESITVVVATFFLTGLMKLFPLWVLLLFVNGYFDMDNLRRSLVVHAFIALFFYYFVERERMKKILQAQHLRNAQIQEEYMEWQLQTLKNQVNPKFLFESLDSLDDLIEKDEERSVELVSRLSHLYRMLLEHKEQLVDLKTELDLIRAYESLLDVRPGKKIRFNYDILETYENWQLPPGALYKLTECFVNGKEADPQEIISIKISTENDVVKVLGPIQNEQAVNLLVNHIKDNYRLFTDRDILIKHKENNLIVTLPLLPLQ